MKLRHDLYQQDRSKKEVDHVDHPAKLFMFSFLRVTLFIGTSGASPSELVLN